MSDSRLAEAAVPSFARHETFAPRFGWLHKAYRAVYEDREVFLRKDAPVLLGVGKNMVNAIRYWSAAFNITVEHPKGRTSRANVASPTWEGYWLLDEEGADPYLEDPGSLWLLHWWLVSPPSLAPTWWLAFHALPSSRFAEEELIELVNRHVRLADWTSPVTSSISKDVDCLTKMYAPRKAGSNSPGSFEDLLDCPFRELGLLESVNAGASSNRTWRFTTTARASLPARIVAYACLDYAARNAHDAGSVSLARLANEPGAPGRAFCIREPELAAALDAACAEHPEIQIADAVGQRSLVFRGNPHALAWRIVDAHYGNIQQKPGFATREQWLDEHPDLAVEMQRRTNEPATRDDELALEETA